MQKNLAWYHQHQHQRKLSKRLHAQLVVKPEDEPLPVIIMLGDKIAQGDEEVRRRVESLGGKVLRELPIIGGFATVLPGRALAELCPCKKISQIHLDRDAHHCLDIGAPSVYADAAQAAGFTGRGVTIAIVDSGIYPHADFMKPTPRIVAWYDAVNQGPQPYDDHGHGTHVAGIAAGSGYSSDGKYRGVAPEAGIAAVKVADAEGVAPMSSIIDGLQWVLDHKDQYQIGVVNLSLGSDPSESYRSDPLCRAVESLWNAGLVVVAAAGNDGPEPGSIDTPGNDPLIVTVGAMDDQQTRVRTDDVVPDFSSRGPTNDGIRKPELMAPGVAIVAPQKGGGYISRTGTSMSTPFVSGAAALLLAKEKGLTPSQVKHRLQGSAERQRLAGQMGLLGYLNVRNLLQLPVEKSMKGSTAVPARKPIPVRGMSQKSPVLAAQAKLRSILRSKLFSLAARLLQLPLLLLLIGVLV